MYNANATLDCGHRQMPVALRAATGLRGFFEAPPDLELPRHPPLLAQTTSHQCDGDRHGDAQYAHTGWDVPDSHNHLQEMASHPGCVFSDADHIGVWGAVGLASAWWRCGGTCMNRY